MSAGIVVHNYVKPKRVRSENSLALIILGYMTDKDTWLAVTLLKLLEA